MSKKMGRAARSWVLRMLSEKDGTPSTKRVCFLMAVTSAIVLSIGLFLRHGFEAMVVDLAGKTIVTAGSAYGITRWAEYGSGPPSVPPPAS